MSYYFKENEFVIENFDKKRAFSSFLPGIAGQEGIPLWAFYANRGQGITSFGLRDKNEPILEFFPANTSYQYVDRYGFRSFVKVDGEVYEPFSVALRDDVKRTMFISRHAFTIEEVNATRKVAYRVTYFGLPNEPVAALVRCVDVVNLGAERQLEVVDGIATLLPSGATTEGFKQMSNLMVSWMSVENMDSHVPFYKFRASSGDEAEVSLQSKGHFYLSFMEDGKIIKPIVDPNLIFGHDTSLTLPTKLYDVALSELDLEHQVMVNKVPCGFTPATQMLSMNQAMSLTTIIGHAVSIDLLQKHTSRFATNAFVDEKRRAIEALMNDLVRVVETKTPFPIFDAYMKQNFLDNTLRGGYPFIFGKGQDQKVYHVYSRKHGDPERDYNFFTLTPEYYSQGNGNFRDVNQNRRNDVFFVPKAGRFNIRMFMSLVQLDGYNPLEVKGTTFTLKESDVIDIVERYGLSQVAGLKEALCKPFTPGKIAMLVPNEAFLHQVLTESEQHIEAVHGEGYWTDHWTYQLDMIESYLKVYPDLLVELLHEDSQYTYFLGAAVVLPRHQKYGLTPQGEVRQYGSVFEAEHVNEARWVKDCHGNIYYTTLAQKLMTLVLTKIALLDPMGMGIEMEANKPGWNDAMNGLPGVFGSGLSETIELLRLVRFLKDRVSKDVQLLEENAVFFTVLWDILSEPASTFERWDKMARAREDFRQTIRNDVSGCERVISCDDIKAFLALVEMVLNDGLKRAKHEGGSILPTYMSYKVTQYEALGYKTPYGLEAVSVKAFQQNLLPHFLEAPARFLSIGTLDENEALHQAVKSSELFDKPLNMYKTSVPLDEMSFEVGRIRAFTPGWLERESNFLHMTYKYMLGLLKGGLYDAFFEEMTSNLVCFMDPAVYGRSTLENASFIATSLNPNPEHRGRGFVARLSGSTSEMLTMWHYMMFGQALFTFDGELSFTPSPILSEAFFSNGYVQTTLLSSIVFVITNTTGFATYSDKIERAHYIVDGCILPCVKGELAHRIRDQKVSRVEVVYRLKEVAL